MNRNYPIITAVDGLPYDSISLLPCATSLGGVIILTTNSLIYVDQAARRVALPVNGWASRVSDMPMPPVDKNLDLSLEGSRLVFVDEKTFFLVRRDGMIHPVEIVLDGRTVSKLVLLPVIAQTTIPAVTRLLNEDLLFVGSMIGPSVLMKTAREEVPLEQPVQQAITPSNLLDSMDLDDDDGWLALLSYFERFLMDHRSIWRFKDGYTGHCWSHIEYWCCRKDSFHYPPFFVRFITCIWPNS